MMQELEMKKKAKKDEALKEKLIAQAMKLYKKLGPFWQSELRRGNRGWYDPGLHFRRMALYELKEVVAKKESK